MAPTNPSRTAAVVSGADNWYPLIATDVVSSRPSAFQTRPWITAT